MKIKYKLVILFAVLICASALPVSLFTLAVQEHERLGLLIRQSGLDARILAKSMAGILLSNGGDITAAAVDAQESISRYSELSRDGLVLAESFLISRNPDYNGLILASADFPGGHIIKTRKSPDETARLAVLPEFSETELPGKGSCYAFTAKESFGEGSYCAARLVFSRAAVASSFVKMRLVVVISMLIAIAGVSIIAVAFSRIITRPVYDLIRGVSDLENGNFEIQVNVHSRDELGRLAVTFNHLAKILRLQINELIGKNRELKRLDQLKDEFMANISHELRSPLYGIIGVTESVIAGASGEISEDAQHDLSLVVQSGRRLSSLVADILDFSKMQHQDLSIQKDPVDLHSVIDYTVHMLRPLLKGKPVVIENRIPESSVFVLGDEERLQQIVLNVAGNAAKFTDEGSVVIRSQLHGRDGMTEILISDTGIGIPRDMIGRIFEPFEQIDGSATRRFGGTGLGLAVTRSLVELHGGSIWVESEEGKGSTFHIFLPSAEPVMLKESSEPVYPNEDAGNGKSRPGVRKGSLEGDILVVDDDPVNIRILINQLSLEGYRVNTASSGAEALTLLEKAPPDLVILDIMMPGLSGFEVCRLIREKYALHDLPVIMLTAKNRTEDIVAALDFGANDYLVKPVRREELVARAGSLISLKRSIATRDELNALKKDMQIAHEIQNFILSEEIPSIEGAAVAVRYKPMYELGGDFYDVRAIDSSTLAVLIADVSGHGVPAALLCAMLKVTYAFFLEYAHDPGVMMTKLNEVMSRYTGGSFITACFALIDLTSGELIQANAGHWPLLVQRGTVFEEVGSIDNGIPLGWMSDTSYTTTSFHLVPGDRVVFYTDCFVEARSRSGQMIEQDGFRSFLSSCRDRDSGASADAVFDCLSGWIGVSPEKGLPDDATIVILDILQEESWSGREKS